MADGGKSGERSRSGSAEKRGGASAPRAEPEDGRGALRSDPCIAAVDP